MPLNVQNREFVTPNDDSGPKPILHTPKKNYPVIKYILQGAFIVLVVASAVFLVYIIALRQLGKEPTIAEETVVSAVDTGLMVYKEPISEEVTPQEKPLIKPAEEPALEQAVITPTDEVKPPAEKPAVRPDMTMTRGSYTVYIASHKIREPADDEVQRWHEAGYEAMVVEANMHFRVAIGQYMTAEDAKIFAEQMWEAFEYGYWIGRVP